ncbi:MAG: hypothetical protein U0807_15175 [Candidatus Binatia bacterium]
MKRPALGKPKARGARNSRREIRINVARNPRHLEDAGKGDLTWWCCHPGASAGDVLVIYKTGAGIQRILEVVRLIADEHGWCGFFGMERAEVRVLRVGAKPISIAQLKSNVILAHTGAVKRSFQGNLFSLKEEELAEIERLLEEAPS